MDRLKIFVYGFAHSGTTILKKLIGDHPDVYEYIPESYDVPEFGDKPHLVFKCPGLPDRRHDRCQRVMIIKNPYDIFGGYYLRYGEEDYLSIPEHTIGDYIKHLEHYLKTDDIVVRYEDLREDIFRVYCCLGLEYRGEVRREVLVDEGIRIPKTRPRSQKEGPMHGKYRTWQVNQPFKDMTGQSAKHLPPYIKHWIQSIPVVRDIYGDYKYLADG